MPFDRRTPTLPLALVVCVLVAAGAAAASQDPAAGEASLELERSARRLIQQGLRNEGFDPGATDGLFGPRTRAAVRDWQQSRGASPTGFLNAAEAQLLRTAERDPAAARRAEAERQRAGRWPPGHLFRDCETCPEMMVLPGSALALGRYEVTLREYRAFASATGTPVPGGCYARASDFRRDYSWRNPPFPQTDRHPVTCVNWDDAQTYVSWLSRTTDAAYRLPTNEELSRAAEGSRPACSSVAADRRGTCPVGNYGTNGLGLSDLLGNVAEWASHCRGDDCRRRTVHGGNWLSHLDSHFLHSPTDVPADRRSAQVGFRVARTLE